MLDISILKIGRFDKFHICHRQGCLTTTKLAYNTCSRYLDVITKDEYMDLIFDLIKTCRRCDYQGGVRGNEDVFHPRGDCRHSDGQWRGDPNNFSISLAFCDLRRFAPLKPWAVEQQNVIWQTDVDELQNYLFFKIWAGETFSFKGATSLSFCHFVSIKYFCQ